MVDGGGETPGPIPNPEAKPARADGTASGRMWESKLPPTLKQNKQLNNHKASAEKNIFFSAGAFCHALIRVIPEMVSMNPMT